VVTETDTLNRVPGVIWRHCWHSVRLWGDLAGRISSPGLSTCCDTVQAHRKYGSSGERIGGRRDTQGYQTQTSRTLHERWGGEVGTIQLFNGIIPWGMMTKLHAPSQVPTIVRVFDMRNLANFEDDLHASFYGVGRNNEWAANGHGNTAAPHH